MFLITWLLVFYDTKHADIFPDPQHYRQWSIVRQYLLDHDVDGLEAHLAQRGTTPYKYGLSLVSHINSNDAQWFFEELALATNDPEFVFGRAWIHWKKGNIPLAERDALFVLEQRPRPIVAARCNYLLGFVWTETNQYDKALEAFERAFTGYAALNKPASMLRTLKGFAYATINLGDLDAAESYLERALDLANQLNPHPNLGYFFELKTRISFAKGDYVESLRYSRLCYEEYAKINDLESMVSARINIGFFNVLNGNLREGIENALEADRHIKIHNFVRASRTNNAVWMLIYRCRNQDYQTLERDLKEWIAHQNDEMLESLRRFVTECECPDF
ncbi:Tetratricopeptide repeat protein [Sulfidibacter corallicola]|uniref:Tetratricopeptide repeat protein n=1 Tax=Sulfidibacter corallicola TaxID=2818388 RepID=A0A8A4TNU7_SULCO|nr:tetratricopeptide repeat protein [Sulfidibacter corallicola]QTD51223.1 tetratricopeptide repeat protein [Sulfidibacter corallicola]